MKDERGKSAAAFFHPVLPPSSFAFTAPRVTIPRDFHRKESTPVARSKFDLPGVGCGVVSRHDRALASDSLDRTRQPEASASLLVMDVPMKFARWMTGTLLIACLTLAGDKPAQATAAAQGTDASAKLSSEVRLRKMHLVRPDLIGFPIVYEVYC